MAGNTGSLTLTVVVSAVTSGLISIATFIVGVRMAKDQGDRAALRLIYQRLFEHFRKLNEAIADFRPLGWEAFPVKGDTYTPLFKQMQADGEANLLPPALMTQCDELESALVIVASRYGHWVRETYIPALTALATERTKGKTGSQTGQSYRALSAMEIGLMPGDARAKFAAGIEKTGTGIGLELSTDRRRTNMTHLYADTLVSGTLGDFLDAAAALRAADADGNGLVTEIESLVPKVDALLRILRARIRDPHPLHASISRAFKDLFQR